MPRSFPLYRQLNQMDCLPTCLRMVAKHHGKHYSTEFLRRNTFVGRTGASLAGVGHAAETIGLRTLTARIPLHALQNAAPLPCIIHWNQHHFVVVHRATKDRIWVADPAHGLLSYTPDEFRKGWLAPGQTEGIALFLEPTPDFHTAEEEPPKSRRNFGFLFGYLKPFKPQMLQVVLGMIVASVLQLAFPFLTQAVVDVGITNQNLGFVYLVLIAQIVLFLGRASLEFVRSWILMHVGSRINISLVSDFLAKLMRLPLSFFDSRKMGDVLERVADHARLNGLLTSSSLNTLFSLVSLAIFGAVLLIYSGLIFTVFIVGAVAVAVWIVLFQRKRRELDYKRFSDLADNKTQLIQIITAMQEIKLNGNEQQKRWDWERSEVKLYGTSMRSLVLNQYQQGGALFLNELKNIVITFIAARQVVAGNMTLGMMMAATYIIGQLNSPLEQLLSLINSVQDAKLTRASATTCAAST